MARSIPEETIKRIKNTANILDIVAETVVLKKAGKDHVGLCPFHAEKTPSFTVSTEKQIFYCFGCHTGGNVFSFVMQQDGLSFPEAVWAVGRKYGIDAPDQRLTSAQKTQLSQKERLYRLNEAASVFFKKILHDPNRGQKAMTYLIGRGMTRKVIEQHQLGYAPNQWDSVLRYFQEKRVPADMLVKAGLVIPRKNSSGYYDRFRDRVIFPILNLNQQIIGFGGRVMGDGMPKYMNSPETSVYNKSRSLYGINRAKQAARKTGQLYLVEGYFDVLALHLYGIENAVATLGTSTTLEHAQAIKGLVGQSGQVVLVYDSDQAGIKAAKRSITVFEQAYLDARILVLPAGHDPDDFLRKYGPDEFFKIAEKAMGVMTFLIESAIQEYGLTLEGKVNIVTALQESLATLQDTVARSLYIQQLAERLNIGENTIMEKIAKHRPGVSAAQLTVPMGKDIANLDSNQRLERQIVAIMLRFPTIIPEIMKRNLIDLFEDAELKKIAHKLATQSNTEASTVADMVTWIENAEYRNLLTKLAMGNDRWDADGCRRLLDQFEGRCRRRSINDLQRQIEDAEKNNNIELLGKLLRKKQKQAWKGMTHS